MAIRYNDSGTQYSSEHVTYNGVETPGFTGLSMRVTTLRKSSINLVSSIVALKESYSSLPSQVTSLNKSSINLVSRVTTVYAKGSRILSCSLIVIYAVGVSNLSMRVKVIPTFVPAGGALPGGRVFLRRSKRYRLVAVEDSIRFSGTVLKSKKGIIYVLGSSLNSKNQRFELSGSALKISLGSNEILSDSVSGVLGRVNCSGACLSKQLSKLDCKGGVYSNVSNGVLLTGQKDVIATLVALDMFKILK